METIKTILQFIFLALVFLASLLIGNKANAQSWDGVHVYFPKYTKHYGLTEGYIGDIYKRYPNGSEGGTRGLIVSGTYRRFTLSLGAMENSYGTNSEYAIVGYSLYENDKIQISANVGVANGYQMAYNQKRQAEILTNIMGENLAGKGYIPLGLVVAKYRVYKKVGVQLNFSPIFVNGGFYFQF